MSKIKAMNDNQTKMETYHMAKSGLASDDVKLMEQLMEMMNNQFCLSVK